MRKIRKREKKEEKRNDDWRGVLGPDLIAVPVSSGMAWLGSLDGQTLTGSE